MPRTSIWNQHGTVINRGYGYTTHNKQTVVRLYNPPASSPSVYLILTTFSQDKHPSGLLQDTSTMDKIICQFRIQSNEAAYARSCKQHHLPNTYLVVTPRINTPVWPITTAFAKTHTDYCIAMEKDHSFAGSWTRHGRTNHYSGSETP